MNNFIKSILSILTVTISGIQINAAENVPNLVIGFHIDGLKSEYMEWLMDNFTKDGFKEIKQKSFFKGSFSYNSDKLDIASSTARLTCGTLSSANGIIARKYFDRNLGLIVSSLYDTKYLGNFTEEKFSPENIMCSTIGDELSTATKGKSIIYSIGINAEETIIAGGRNADGAYWIDGNTGEWCSSTYYKSMPVWLEKSNEKTDIHKKFANIEWSNHYTYDHYNIIPTGDKVQSFSHKLSKTISEAVSSYKEYPDVNEEILSLAKRLIEKEDMGQDGIPDYLSIGLSASEPCLKDKTTSTEWQDKIYRLDEALGKFLTEIKKEEKEKNIIFYIAGTENNKGKAEKENGNRNFFTNRCSSLLNLYLTALYGNGKWISGLCNNQIYLNTDLIEENKLDLDVVTKKSVSFLSKISGIKKAMPATTKEIAPYINNAKSGDIILEIYPGWNVINNNGEKSYNVRLSGTYYPILFYGRGFEKRENIQTISYADIAASVCYIFRIRPPNGCEGKTLFKQTINNKRK